MDVRVNYKEGKAVSVDFAYDNDVSYLSVFMEKELETPILGNFRNDNKKKYSFIPLVPFSDGQTYEIREQKRTIAKFKVVPKKFKTAPEILAIYPSTDTVPENLLKLYLKFSEPMQEVGQVLDFIQVIDENEGVEKKLFLEMESELWNRDHDFLTLWLDPGRIKTDLIPNKERGMPLLKGHTYSINISDTWKSAQGQPLNRSYTKTIVVKKRDNKKPTVKDWKIELPQANSIEALNLFFQEPMDAVLSSETISIHYDSQDVIMGNFKVAEGEKKVSFFPILYWKKGRYEIKINPILEDLAGNNLNRLFDEDLTDITYIVAPLETYSLFFNIK